MSGYNPKLSHLYLAGTSSATLSIIETSKDGIPKFIGIKDTVKGSPCITGNKLDEIWVCDPGYGQLLLFKDNFSPKH